MLTGDRNASQAPTAIEQKARTCLSVMRRIRLLKANEEFFRGLRLIIIIRVLYTAVCS